MKTNRTYKIITAIFIFIILISPVVFATTNQTITPNNTQYQPPTINQEQSIEEMGGQLEITRDHPVVTVTRKVLSILQLIGVSVGLIMLVVTGIKFIVADEKPKVKDVAIGYIVGAFCIFGATGILTLIQQLVKEFTTIV